MGYYEMDGADVANNCGYYTEGYPTAPQDGSTWVIPFQRTIPNAPQYTSLDTWPTPSNIAGLPVAGGYASAGDSWSTWSGFTGQLYVSNTASKNNQSCVGIAATTPANLQTGAWKCGIPQKACSLKCANTPHGDATTGQIDDGPSIFYNDVDHDLWIAAADYSPRGFCSDGFFSLRCIRVYGFTNCGKDQPGGGSCPQTVSRGLRNFAVAAHPTVKMHPVTRWTMVAYRDVGNAIRLAFLDR
ncbi:MAG TPA: hypothetical protein VGJ84_14235, partial [Polyangiaceae bacterium]